jgi:hypothetical protein
MQATKQEHEIGLTLRKITMWIWMFEGRQHMQLSIQPWQRCWGGGERRKTADEIECTRAEIANHEHEQINIRIPNEVSDGWVEATIPMRSFYQDWSNEGTCWSELDEVCQMRWYCTTKAFRELKKQRVSRKRDLFK